MKHIFILLTTLWSTQAAAQRYTYTTRTMTECFSTTQTSFGPAKPTQGGDKYWTVEMPECQDCLCTDCAYTNTYTTTLDVFSPTGIAKFPYQVKEIYRGMSAMPADATPTSAVPYGFTSDVETCKICGDEPVTATMTYPRGGSPYQDSVPTATLAAQTVIQRPSTLRTQFADTEATGAPSNDNGTRPLENTVLEHKVVKYKGKAPDAADFARLIGSSSGLDVDDANSKTRRNPSRDIRSYAKMRFESAEAAPSKDADGAATSRRPPSAVIALLVPIALLI